MEYIGRICAKLTVGLVAVLMCASGAIANRHGEHDLDNTTPDVTLFRGAANNPYFELYFNALPAGGGQWRRPAGATTA